ncbi:hypothetical protein L1987_89651 [Smallanthus sonchifolius]|nr:hypothetical protein L1987_89651 [Smallanthus sonchifolius]
MSEDDLPFLERTMLRHWVLQWLKLVSWYYTVLASDYVTIEEALSGPVVATDWRAQKDVNSALLNGRDGVMFCTGTLTSIVSGYTLVQQAGVTQPTAVLFRSFNVATSEKDPSLSWLEKMEDVESSKILVPPCPLEVPAPVPQDAELYEQVLQPLPDLMQPLPDPFDLSNLLFNSIVDPLWDSIPLKLFDILTNGEFSIPQGTAVRFLLDLGEK